MTKTEKRKWLGAIGKLERFYRVVVNGKKRGYFRCPLCVVINYRCQECLWNRFEKTHCDKYAFDKYHDYASSLRTRHAIDWAKDSRKRLARWRVRLEKE